MREVMVPAGPGGSLVPVKWTDLEALLLWDERQTPRLTKLTKAHVYLNPFSRMRCGLATEAFEAVVKYASQPAEVKRAAGAPGKGRSMQRPKRMRCAAAHGDVHTGAGRITCDSPACAA
jgi:hypothetical protein